MAQSPGTLQGTKRRHPGFSSPPGLHAEECESRRPPCPPTPGALSGHQAPPQVGVIVVTIDMFREYQKHVASAHELYKKQIAALHQHVQTLEKRIGSLEDAEDLAIDAVREIRDEVIPRVDQHDQSLGKVIFRLDQHDQSLDKVKPLVEQHHQSLDTLSSAVGYHNKIIETLGNFTHEQRPKPGPLGGPDDYISKTIRDMKTQLTRSFASLAEHERHVAEHDTRMETRLRDFDAHLRAHERRLIESEGRLVEHAERLGALDKTSGLLSPTQVTTIIQSHQQRISSLENDWEAQIKNSREVPVLKPISPQSQPLSASGDEHTLGAFTHSQNGSPPDQPPEAAMAVWVSEPPVKKVRREEENPVLDLRLKVVAEQLHSIDRRLDPLENRMRAAEETLDTITQAATTPESMAKDQSPVQERFDILRQTDFQSEEEMAALKSNEDTQFLMQLYSEMDKCEGTCYTVQRACVHMWTYLLCRSRTNARLISDFWKRDDWLSYPTVLELERSDSMPKGKYFPRYVYEVGEIFNRMVVTKHRGGQATHRSTGYHLVVDVTRPEKSLWLVYRYAEDGDGQSLRQGITYKQDTFWHPFANVGEYDIAMVFERFDDWEGADTPVGSFAASKKLVRQTGCVIKPTFIEPILDEVKAEIRQSWKARSKAITQ